jgi:hypothetical protein
MSHAAQLRSAAAVASTRPGDSYAVFFRSRMSFTLLKAMPGL